MPNLQSAHTVFGVFLATTDSPESWNHKCCIYVVKKPAQSIFVEWQDCSLEAADEARRTAGLPSPLIQCQPETAALLRAFHCWGILEELVGWLLGRTTAEAQWDGVKMQLCRASCNATGDSVPNICLHSKRNPLGFGSLQEGSIAIPS